jgi:hypothetical protein
MKTLFAMAATAALVISASQASAQTAVERRYDPAFEAFAQSPLPPRAGQRGFQYRPNVRAHSINPAWDVYDTQGNYIGSDPDPFIRNDLMRAPPNRGDD